MKLNANSEDSNLTPLLKYFTSNLTCFEVIKCCVETQIFLAWTAFVADGVWRNTGHSSHKSEELQSGATSIINYAFSLTKCSFKKKTFLHFLC